MDRDLISVANHSCGAVARAGRGRERENNSTSVETTGHLSVRALSAQLCQPPFEEGSV